MNRVKLAYKPATEPNDLEQLFIERANAGDIDGLVALYEPDAVVDFGNGRIAEGAAQIRDSLVEFLADRPQFKPSNQVAALCGGDLALTSSRASNGDRTAEIARRQPGGTWLWVIDRFSLE